MPAWLSRLFIYLPIFRKNANFWGVKPFYCTTEPALVQIGFSHFSMMSDCRALLFPLSQVYVQNTSLYGRVLIPSEGCKCCPYSFFLHQFSIRLAGTRRDNVILILFHSI